MRPIRVFLVDDTATVRHILVGLMEEDPGIRVVGTAADGTQALRRLQHLEVDVLVLDVEMPGMSGLEVLREVRVLWPRLPVVIFSSITERGAMVTIEALSLGATDYVTKPSMTGSPDEAREYIRGALLAKLHAVADLDADTSSRPVSPPPAIPYARRREERVDAVVVGVSMGGPQALHALFRALPGDLPVPLFVVQHMPALFISALARRLSGEGGLPVEECLSARLVGAGKAWIASGGYHMELRREPGGVRACPTLGEPVNFCRPSVDVLFNSAVAAYGPHVLGVVMTGMGHDGLAGSAAIREAGGQVIAQDRDSSVVWGMAGAVVEAGLTDTPVPLAGLAVEICQRVAVRRSWEPAHRVGDVPRCPETGV